MNFARLLGSHDDFAHLLTNYDDFTGLIAKIVFQRYQKAINDMADEISADIAEGNKPWGTWDWRPEWLDEFISEEDTGYALHLAIKLVKANLWEWNENGEYEKSLSVLADQLIRIGHYTGSVPPTGIGPYVRTVATWDDEMDRELREAQREVVNLLREPVAEILEHAITAGDKKLVEQAGRCGAFLLAHC